MARNPGSGPIAAQRARRQWNGDEATSLDPEAGGHDVPFQAVLESITDGAIVLDGDCRCTYVNETAAAFLKTTPDQLIGRLIWGAFPRPRHDRLHAELTRAVEQKIPVKFEEHCSRCGRWFDWRCYPAQDGLAVFIEDVTERKRAEETLSRSEQRYRKLFETCFVGIYSTKPDGTILDFNDAMMKMLGYDSREEFFQHRSSDFYADPEFREKVIRLLQKDGVVPGQEARLRRKDGSVLHALGAAVLLTDEQTGEPYIQGVAVNVSRRREAEQALRQSEQRLRSMLESSLDVVYRRDLRKDRYDYLSPVAEKILGFPPADMGDWNIDDVLARIHPDDVQRMRQELSEAITIGQGKVEYRFRRKDGRFCWLADHFTVQKDEKGRPVYFAGVVRDNTTRHEAEEALRVSEERLRLALEGGQMGRWEWDPQTNSMFWCKRIYELLGLDASVPAGIEAFLARVHPDDRQAVQTHMAAARHEQKTHLEIEFRIFRRPLDPPGEIPWLASHAKAIRDEHGQTVRMIGVMYDITKRKQMEDRLRRLNNRLTEEVQSQTEELRSSANRMQDEVMGRVLAESELQGQSQMLEGFFQHTITPLAFLDRDFNFVRVNQAFAQAADRSPDYFPGKNYFVLLPGDPERAIFEHVVRTGEPYFAQARPFTDPDRPERPVSYWDWQLTPLLDDGGRVQSLVLNCADVTQRQRAYSELEHRARQLQKLARELSETEDRERQRLAEILHDDLQQTLAAAKFHVGLLKRGAQQDPAQQALAAEIDHMLRDAIDKSRSLSHELSPALLHQGDFIETLEWLADKVQAQHGLTVRVQTHGGLGGTSDAIRAFLYRATQELLFNVIKHAQTGEAAIRVRRMGRCISLAVSDEGRGFDPQNLRETNGFGLLSLRERAEVLGGRMTIKSAAGKGSTFQITVPDDSEGT